MMSFSEGMSIVLDIGNALESIRLFLSKENLVDIFLNCVFDSTDNFQ